MDLFRRTTAEDFRALSSTIHSSISCGIAIKMSIRCHEDLVVDITLCVFANSAYPKDSTCKLSSSIAKSLGIAKSRQTVCRRLHESHLYSRRPSVRISLTPPH
ncbi:hypothetical protein TNCV_3454631 [Trichonephila clavipes]|nr:hypothetical protein TNCV_3454631 [Trichonephila clavipes]